VNQLIQLIYLWFRIFNSKPI